MTARTVNTTAETYTLSGTTADTITVTAARGAIRSVRIINRAASGGAEMWAAGARTPAAGKAEMVVAAATVGGSDCHPIPAQGWWGLDLSGGYYDTVTVSVVGSGNTYTVEVDR
jgi:hypothetical protein